MFKTQQTIFRNYFQEFEFSKILKPNFRYLKFDFIGGLTSAIVALPLALGFGLLSFNGNPQGAVAGLYGAIFTGILASFFGGTPLQITGPTGGMTVVLTEVYIHYGGVEALLAACILAGLFQIGFGLMKLGKYVHLVPYPVIVGFTNGIAILIFTQQFKTFNTAPIIALITMGIIYVIPKFNKNLPKALIGLIIGSLTAYFFSSTEILRTTFSFQSNNYFTVQDAIATIGTIPSSFQMPHLPYISLETWQKVVPAGFTISLLGAIETLLASVVSDNATNSRHNSNKELIGQGIANYVAPFFGGVAGTGAVVRTMVNIRAGAKTQLSGIIHGVVLIIVMIFLGGLAANIPLAALAGVLMMTAVGMFETEPLRLLPKTPIPDSVVMLTTIAITVFVDLITAVEVGMVMAAFLFVHRMSNLGMAQVNLDETHHLHSKEWTQRLLAKHNIAIFDVEGPLFFGAARSFVDSLEKNFEVKIVILDLQNVPIIDTTGAMAVENIVHRLYKDKKRFLVVGIRPQVRKTLYNLGITQKIGIGNFLPNMEEAIAYAVSLSDEKIKHERLSDYITDNLILLDVDADSKEKLFEQMISQGLKAKVIKSKIDFLRSVLSREQQMPTTIGHGIAVPHGRVGVNGDAVVVIFARLKNEIVYDASSEEKVRFVFLVSTGSNEKEYLNILRMIGTNMTNENIYRRLLNAKDVSEAHHIFAEIKVQAK